jgi:predicted enzyme related to lactoylglutathione lyase
MPLIPHSLHCAHMGSVITEINIDCANTERVAQFWADVLGWQLQRKDDSQWMSDSEDPDDFLWMSESGDATDGGLILVFVQVPEPKTVKNRVHIDISPCGSDQAAETERLIALGARRVDIGQGDVPWVVLADPEGNEFCLLRRRRD